MRHFTFTTLPICAVLFFLGTWLVNAGDLTPPSGPPAPTGRFGPRIDVNSLPGDGNSVHRITQPGSYYLSANVTGPTGFNGIEIAADNVTLDLNGFAVIGEVDSLTGITASGKQICVKNGSVQGWGDIGVIVVGDASRVANVRSSDNDSWGISVGAGFNSLVTDCQAQNNGLAQPNSGGFLIGCDATIDRCVSMCNTGRGIVATFRCLISNCNVSFNTTVGIEIVGGDSLLRGNMLSSNTTSNASGIGIATSTLIDNRGA